MNYKHIIFDIDGTLLDTEKAILSSLQETLAELQNKKVETSELHFALGIPGDPTLQQLGFEDIEAANKTWYRNYQKYHHTVSLFDGIATLIKELKQEGYCLGIITSKTRAEYVNEFLPFGLGDYFDTVICPGDSDRPKPFADPMLKYLEITGIEKKDVIYIGDSIYDSQCAKAAGVDFGLALWGAHSVKHIHATYYFQSPQEILYSLHQHTDSFAETPWLKWAMELQFIAQAGMTYSKDNFDIERFERIGEIAAEIMSRKSGLSLDLVKDLFCNETGFQTPKLDTRAAIFQDDKILLVQEKNGTWSLPGGWVDINESIKSNTIKEVREEAGLNVIPVKLIAVQDRNKHNLPVYAYSVCKAFVLCKVIDGDFHANTETIKSDYFDVNNLPLLAEEKNSKEQISMCFDAVRTKDWNTIFD